MNADVFSPQALNKAMREAVDFIHAEGWDQGPTLFALVPTDATVIHFAEPEPVRVETDGERGDQNQQRDDTEDPGNNFWRSFDRLGWRGETSRQDNILM